MSKKCIVKDCCCKCKLRRKVYKHPCNIVGHGQISKLFGFVCDALSTNGEDHLIFMDRLHSCGCECFEGKSKEFVYFIPSVEHLKEIFKQDPSDINECKQLSKRNRSKIC